MSNIDHFIAGEIAGMIGVTMAHPFDTIKTKIQMNKTSKYVYINIHDKIQYIIHGYLYQE